MHISDYRVLRTAVRDNASPATRDERALVRNTLEASLRAARVFADIEVEATDDDDAMVIAMCTFAAHLDEDDVAVYLERLWTERLAFDLWEAHTLLRSRGQVEILGSTRSGGGRRAGHFVTLHLLARRGTIPTQRGPVD